MRILPAGLGRVSLKLRLARIDEERKRDNENERDKTDANHDGVEYLCRRRTKRKEQRFFFEKKVELGDQ